jgi:hypothetical protein
MLSYNATQIPAPGNASREQKVQPGLLGSAVIVRSDE